MQNHIEQHPEYASKIKNNLVKLMLAIRASMHEAVRAQMSILTLFSALTKFLPTSRRRICLWQSSTSKASRNTVMSSKLSGEPILQMNMLRDNPNMLSSHLSSGENQVQGAHI
jgi:uncharacterized membrane protein